nr:cinnamoyl-CoA reductase 1-like [Ipomoea batatas]
MSMERKVVCVTGASGFIASWLIKHLLHRGYTIHATVRNLSQSKGGTSSLRLMVPRKDCICFEADLLEETSFDPAISGCEELVDPAVKGTLNVLGSCAKIASVKRVVITSSTASVMFKRNPISPEEVVDETWFSDKEYAEEAKEKNGIDLVVLHPTIVIGPILHPTLNFSNALFLDLIKEGKEVMPTGIYTFVDIRDVINAHIQALELQSASGRYCLVGTTIHSSQVLKIVAELYPSLAIPEKYKDDLSEVRTYQVSQRKAKSLGITFTSFDVSLKDVVECLKEKKFLGF